MTQNKDDKEKSIIDRYFFTIIGVTLFFCGLSLAMLLAMGKLGQFMMILGLVFCIFEFPKDEKMKEVLEGN